MSAASGVYKQVAIKKETSYGVLPAAAGARLLDRVDATFNLQKQAYESARIRTDLQMGDNRHGVRTVNGAINDELCPGSHSDLIGSLLKRPFSAVSPVAGLSITIEQGADGEWSIERDPGSWMTDGIRVGQVIRLSGAGLSPDNTGKNLFVVRLSELVAVVKVVNSTALVEEVASGVSVVAPGGYTFIPVSGHVEESYAVEEWFADIAVSEVFVGWKPAQASIKLPPSGLATIGITGEGKDLARTGTASYFTNPASQSAQPSLASVNGLLRIDGQSPGVCITGLDFDITSAYSGDPCVGSSVKNHQFAEGVTVKGSFTAYFVDGVLPAKFFAETAMSLDVLLTADNSAAADFMTFSIPRVKVNSADKSDGKGGIVRTYQFTASINPTAGASEQTTIAVQDSRA